MLDVAETVGAAHAHMFLTQPARLPAVSAFDRPLNHSGKIGALRVQPAAEPVRTYADPRVSRPRFPATSPERTQQDILRLAQGALAAQKTEIETFVSKLHDQLSRHARPFEGFRFELGGKKISLSSQKAAEPKASGADQTDALIAEIAQKNLIDALPAAALRQIYGDVTALMTQANRTLNALQETVRHSYIAEKEEAIDANIRAMVAERLKEQIEEAITRCDREEKLTELFDFQGFVRWNDLRRMLNKAEMMAALGQRGALVRTIEATLAEAFSDKPVRPEVAQRGKGVAP